jgi:hypothetical protein
MNCRAITSAERSTGSTCRSRAISDGLCRVHLRQRDQLPKKIARMESALSDERARLAMLILPDSLENPS